MTTRRWSTPGSAPRASTAAAASATRLPINGIPRIMYRVASTPQEFSAGSYGGAPSGRGKRRLPKESTSGHSTVNPARTKAWAVPVLNSSDSAVSTRLSIPRPWPATSTTPMPLAAWGVGRSRNVGIELPSANRRSTSCGTVGSVPIDSDDPRCAGDAGSRRSSPSSSRRRPLLIPCLPLVLDRRGSPLGPQGAQRQVWPGCSQPAEGGSGPSSTRLLHGFVTVEHHVLERRAVIDPTQRQRLPAARCRLEGVLQSQGPQGDL